jgi:hypothetical protein
MMVPETLSQYDPYRNVRFAALKPTWPAPSPAHLHRNPSALDPASFITHYWYGGNCTVVVVVVPEPQVTVSSTWLPNMSVMRMATGFGNVLGLVLAEK